MAAVSVLKILTASGKLVEVTALVLNEQKNEQGLKENASYYTYP